MRKLLVFLVLVTMISGVWASGTAAGEPVNAPATDLTIE